MTCVTFDCADPELLCTFWSAALGWEVRGHCVASPDPAQGYLEFCVVPEPKTVKNRVHVGTSCDDLDAEIVRLVELGATVAYEEDMPPGWGRNAVLRDPGGNEFCLGASQPPAH